MSVAELKHQLEAALDERDYFKSLVESFFTGNVPRRATLNHVIMAKWGRVRLEDKRRKPALLDKEITNIDKDQ